jgi:predicted transposase YbfD/YdcC
LREDLELFFRHRRRPAATTVNHGHGRIETRRIWVTRELNEYLKFPGVGQSFVIERETVDKKSGKTTRETAYGVTSLPRAQAGPRRLLALNRGHWCIENSCHYILDWNWDEDRGRIRTGYGPENISRLRRFAIGVIKGQLAKQKRPVTVAQKIRDLAGSVRLVFDYLKMTENSRRRPLAA